MEELVKTIQELGQISWLDYVQLIATIISIIISAIAVVYAVKIPKKISDEQNKIALFEKRYEVFQLFERCFAFKKALQKSKTVEDMRIDCILLFDDLKYDKFDYEYVVRKMPVFEQTLHKMQFLFSGISENDTYDLYHSLLDITSAIISNDNVENCKSNYIKTMSNFAHKYHKTIWDELSLMIK